MPTRLCTHPTCPNPATYRGRCPSHTRQNEQATHPNKQLYNSKRWQTTRRKVLFENPLCQCGCGNLSTDVDHKTPIEQGGNAWARANLQALSHECHSKKTRAEQAAQ